MCNLTISSILQKPNKTPTEYMRTLAYVVMKRVKQCTHTFRVCSFTAWFSLLKCIKNDHKIQDMREENVYIFTFHIVKITQRVPFFPSKISMITNVILILYNSSINNKLTLRDLRFRHHIACFCSISQTKNYSKQLQHCFASPSNMSFVPEWINRLNDSVQSQWLTYYQWLSATYWLF